MRALLDVNVLIALVQLDHTHHERAHEWWSANLQDGWASCPLTQNGFVRVVAQLPSLRPFSVSMAIETLAKQMLSTDHAFWPDDISLVDTAKFDRSCILGPKQITDIYLLALAVRNDGCLVTFDRSIPFAAAKGSDPLRLVVL